MDAIEQQRAADEERTKRLFVGFLSSALGVDQTMTGADAGVGQRTGQYVLVNPETGDYSVQGQSYSNRNGFQTATGGLSATTLLIIAGLVWLALK